VQREEVPHSILCGGKRKGETEGLERAGKGDKKRRGYLSPAYGSTKNSAKGGSIFTSRPERGGEKKGRETPVTIGYIFEIDPPLGKEKEGELTGEEGGRSLSLSGW